MNNPPNLGKPKILYKIIKENSTEKFINNKLWAHLHCYDINKFDEIYGRYIKEIMKYFSVVVTYSNGDKTPEYDFSILNILNKGADIGAKICCIKYLNIKSIAFRSLLFLHSKFNKTQRQKYFDPFIKTVKQLNYICSIIYHYDLIIPNLIHNGDWNKKKYYTINKYYYEWYNNYMGYKHLTDLFVEGNCLIASKTLISKIFSPNELDFFYSKCNTKNTFDYNWVKIQYKLWNKSYNEVYELFKKHNFKPNYLSYNGEKVINKYEFIFSNDPVNIHNNFLKDGAYEHLWERLWINICENINGKYKIVDVIESINLNYNFDTNIYRLCNSNNIKDEDNSIENINIMKNKVYNNEDSIYSAKQILEKLPLNFDIVEYSINNKLKNKNKYEIIHHFIQNNKYSLSNNAVVNYSEQVNTPQQQNKWIDIQHNFNKIKTFVIVFPQFHEIPENNDFWGNGFTEWWNVRKTFQIHNEHLPMHPHEDIGYYNILDIETRKRWDSYAHDYGFEGYIFYHYWFSKGIIMNKPLDKILEDGQPNKPWFLNWVNENWTKRWDGGNNDILLDVKLDEESCYKHIYILMKYFKHKNYYKVDNKPFLAIYRPEEIPKSYIVRLIQISKEYGFDGITFIKTLNNKLPNNFKINSDEFCDYEMEFPPNYSGSLVDARITNNNFKYNIDSNFSYNYDIGKHYMALTKTKPTNKKLIRGIVPCWDNFPRHSNNTSFSHIQIGTNSLLFYFILVKQFLLIRREKGEYYIINSLNEWAEQCIMEPSIQNEYSYLEAFKLAKKTDLDSVNEILLDKILNF